MSDKTILLKNAIVLTMDDDYQVFEPGAVVVSSDLIAAVGAEGDVLRAFPDAEVIDCGGKVLMPGLN